MREDFVVESTFNSKLEVCVKMIIKREQFTAQQIKAEFSIYKCIPEAFIKKHCLVINILFPRIQMFLKLNNPLFEKLLLFVCVFWFLFFITNCESFEYY